MKILLIIFFLSFYNSASAYQDVEASDIENFGKKLLNTKVRVQACILNITECRYNEGFYCVALSEAIDGGCNKYYRQVSYALLKDKDFSLREVKILSNTQVPVIFFGKIIMGKGSAGVLDATKIDFPVFIVDKLNLPK